MFDIGGWELLVIGALALIIVGPKDLPRMIRSVGQWVAKARGLAREFQTGMEQAAREADLNEIRDIAKIDTGVEKGLRALDAEVRSAGSEAKSALDAAARGDDNPSAVSNPPSSTPSLGATQPTTAASDPAPAKPSRPTPTAPSAPKRPTPIDDDAPRGAVSGPRSEDDQDFLERFERGVRPASNGRDPL